MTTTEDLGSVVDIEKPDLVVISLGAGVQSTTLALLAADGVLPKPDVAVFADTGWEPRHVYEHLDRLELAMKDAGIPLVRVQAGNLIDDALDPNKPVRLPLFIKNPDGSIGKTARTCTDRYKIRPIREYLRLALGAKVGEERVCGKCEGSGQRVAPWRAKSGVHEVGQCSVCEGTGTISRVGPVPKGKWIEQWIGFSTDEIGRVSPSRQAYVKDRYPLLELDMSRTQCMTWLTTRGWGSTPKSACIGCPFHGNKMWRDMRDNDPESWADAIAKDELLRHDEQMRGEQYLHRSGLPLAEAPIDKIEPKELKEGQIDIFDAIFEDGDQMGCSPYGCRSDVFAEPQVDDEAENGIAYQL